MRDLIPEATAFLKGKHVALAKVREKKIGNTVKNNKVSEILYDDFILGKIICLQTRENSIILIIRREGMNEKRRYRVSKYTVSAVNYVPLEEYFGYDLRTWPSFALMLKYLASIHLLLHIQTKMDIYNKDMNEKIIRMVNVQAKGEWCGEETLKVITKAAYVINYPNYRSFGYGVRKRTLPKSILRIVH